MTEDLLWPQYATPDDLAAIEAVPLVARGVAGVHDIEATIEDSSVVATVKIHPSAHEAAVKAILGRYAIEWRLVVLS